MTSATMLASAEMYAHRAIELAEAAHLTATAQIIERTSTYEVFAVPSKDRSRTHSVTLDSTGSTRMPRCDCPADHYGRPCAHAGAVLHYQRQRLAAMAARDGPDEAWLWWMAGGEW